MPIKAVIFVNKEKFRDRLIKIMNEKDIKQPELSLMTGITQSSISDYINGKYSPKQDKIDLLAKALGVSPTYLLGYEEDFQESSKIENEDYAWIARNAKKLSDEKKKKLKEIMKLTFDFLDNEEDEEHDSKL